MNFGVACTQWLEYLDQHDELIIGTSMHQPFNRSAARNDAFDRSDGDIIIIADADTLFVPSVMDTAVKMVRDTKYEWVMPYTTYYNAHEDWSMSFRQHPRPLQEEDERNIHFEHQLPGATSGVLVLSRLAFDAVNGYDERFVGWGWEDIAFSCALNSQCGPLTRVPGYVVHLWHPHPHETNFGQPYNEQNKALYDRYYAAEHNLDAMDELCNELGRTI